MENETIKLNSKFVRDTIRRRTARVVDYYLFPGRSELALETRDHLRNETVRQYFELTMEAFYSTKIRKKLSEKKCDTRDILSIAQCTTKTKIDHPKSDCEDLMYNVIASKKYKKTPMLPQYSKRTIFDRLEKKVMQILEDISHRHQPSVREAYRESLDTYEEYGI